MAAALLPLAGCLWMAPPGTNDAGSGTVSQNSLPTSTPPPSFPPLTENQRWHYHNYWGNSPSLVLLNANLTLPVVQPSAVSAQPRTATIEFSLPHGHIVPPETGEINVTIFFNSTVPDTSTGLNFSYRPGGAVNFTGRHVVPGKAFSLWVDYDQTDVPHQGSTMWRFRLGPESVAAPVTPGPTPTPPVNPPNGTPPIPAAPPAPDPAFANGTAHVIIVAWMGRPLLIDPPHFDHWLGRTTVPLVEATINASDAMGPSGKDVHMTSAGATIQPYVAEIPLPNGSLVPEGSGDVTIMLFWNATGGMAKPGLAYAEDNSPSNGTLTPVEEKAGYRLYKVPIKTGMTDSPYVNKSTWRFDILVDGQPGTVLDGVVSLHAFANRAPQSGSSGMSM
ncbi:MAG: hypothetical protein ACYDDF_01185 [Thermoplasmatota archaeon]